MTTDPPYLPMIEKNAISARAVDVYLADAGEDRRDMVTTSVPFRDLWDAGEGWWHIANLTDWLADRFWRILWREADGAVRLDGPRR